MKHSLPATGVPIQVHAFIAPPPPVATAAKHSDVPSLHVRDGKLIELSNGAETTSLRVDHVFPAGSTERDVAERALLPLVKACVDGVNVAVLAVGSAAARKSALLFELIATQSILATLFEMLLASLHAKAAALNSSSSANTTDNGVTTRAIATAKKSPFAFELAVSCVEFFDETMTDLLAAATSATPAAPSLSPMHSSSHGIYSSNLVIEDSALYGKRIANLSMLGPIASVDAFEHVLQAARRARRNDNGLYGHASEFSSVILTITLQQTFRLPDGSDQALVSSVRAVELPVTDRLARPGGAVRLSEGPLLNKALFAVADVLEHCANETTDGSSKDSRSDALDESPSPLQYPPYDASHLTTMLHDVIGGNCVTLALLALAPNDFVGTQASIQLGRMLTRVSNAPVVNTDVMRRLVHRHWCRIASLQQVVSADDTDDTSRRLNGSVPAAVLPTVATIDRLRCAFERQLHDLEGRVAHEALAARCVRDDNAAINKLLAERTCAYRAVVAAELDGRRELLACEQDKLALGQALVQLAADSRAHAETLERDKVDVKAKLQAAEARVLALELDVAAKTAQIQDVIAQLHDLERSKQAVADELTTLQREGRERDAANQREAAKNQQLSLELLVAVNQRQRADQALADSELQRKQLAVQLETAAHDTEPLRNEIAVLQNRVAAADAQVETLRRELVAKDLEAERIQSGRAITTAAATAHITTLPSGGPVSHKTASAAAGTSDEPQNEHNRVQLELRDALAQLAVERDRLGAAKLRVAELEHSSQTLTAAYDALVQQVNQQQHVHDSEQQQQHVSEIRALHDALLSQLADVRTRLIEQQQSVSVAVPPVAKQVPSASSVYQLHLAEPSPGHSNNSRSTSSNSSVTTAAVATTTPHDVALLVREKLQLAARLAASTQQWTAAVEHVERRCAELLTQNVMLAQENSDLRDHLQVRM